MADHTELTHEQLVALIECRLPFGLPRNLCDALTAAGLVERYRSNDIRNGRSVLTPRGRELVDIAVRATNAELRERVLGVPVKAAFGLCALAALVISVVLRLLGDTDAFHWEVRGSLMLILSFLVGRGRG